MIVIIKKVKNNQYEKYDNQPKNLPEETADSASCQTGTPQLSVAFTRGRMIAKNIPQKAADQKDKKENI